MANYIQKYGNQLVVVLNGVKYTAVPTGGDIWYIDNAYPGPGPGPGPNPIPPGDEFMWPFNTSSVSSEYGMRNGKVHQGIDFAQGLGTPIPASNSGVVFLNENYGEDRWGNTLIINHGVIDNRQIYTLYGHMQFKSDLAVGSNVAKGAIVGLVNNTGSSDGNHLHWETHIAAIGIEPRWSNPGTHVNPRDFMRTYG